MFIKQEKSKRKDISFYRNNSHWLYRFILIVILLFLINVGNFIALFDNLRNPVLRKPNQADLEINIQEDTAYLEGILNNIFPSGTKQFSNEEKMIPLVSFVAVNLKNINNL